jgi:nitrogen regulatory protein PII-like uncharacterized protein
MKSFSFFGLLFIALSLFAQDIWKLEREKNGIKVFTRKTAKSSMKESKTEIYLKEDPEELINFFKDISNHKTWMHRIITSKLLKKLNENEFYAYYVASAPWPVSNRDVVVHYKIQKESNDNYVIIATGIPNEIPEEKGLVRIPKLHCTWEFFKQPNGTTKLIYTLLSEPGGDIPEWLANSGATDTPFNTVAAPHKMTLCFMEMYA